MAAAKIKLGLQDTLWLGNLNSKRDWGHAKDYVEGMWKILQYKQPDDFVLATGKTSSVREFCEIAFKKLGIDIVWKGKGIDEVGIDNNTGKIIIRVDKRYFRPTEVDFLLGDSTKAHRELDWKPKYDLQALVEEMVEADLKAAQMML